MTVRIALVLLLLAGCGAAADEAPPQTFDMSAADTSGGEAHGARPAAVAPAADRLLDLLARRVMECLPASRTTLALELSVRRSGTIYAIHGGDLGDARVCVRNVLVGTAITDPLSSEMLLRHTFVRPAAAAAPTTPAVAATTAPQAEDATRATLAALVDAHAPEILTCAGRTLVGVRMRWDAEGHVWLSLQGDLAGSAEESCIRDAIGAPTVAPSTAGELVRLVRAQAP